MPRRGNIAKRDVLQDPVYNSKLVTRLINNIMLDGKKGVAQKIVYGAFEIVAEKTGKDALEVFEQAMERSYLSGSYGGQTRKTSDSRSPLDNQVFQTQKRKDHERKTCR